MADTPTPQSFNLRGAAQTVYDTFVKDEAAGYRSRDRQFAIDLLGKGLQSSPDHAALIARLRAGSAYLDAHSNSTIGGSEQRTREIVHVLREAADALSGDER